MKKILVAVSFFALSFIFLNCERQSSDPASEVQPAAKQKKVKDDASARTGPFYNWNFSTTNQTNPVEYFDTSTGERYFYLKASASYVRSVTLTVQKYGATTSNPTFRIYGNAGQCLLMSTPTVSSGTYTATGTFQHSPFPGYPSYSGYSWTPALGASAVNSTATFTFNVYPQNSSCVEGFISADMTAPGAINSAGSYWDGDYMYFVKNSGL